MSMEYRVPFDEAGVASFDRVRRPRFAHRLARWLVLIVILLGVALAVVPWQQTSFGHGQVLAISPTERPQNIDAPVEGWLSEWFVEEGAPVAAGDPIVRITDNDPELLSRLRRERSAAQMRVEAAEQAVRVAQLNVNRQRSLEARGLAARREVEQAQLAMTEAQRDLASARAELARTETTVTRQDQQLVTAPRAGVILRRAAGEGAIFVRQGDQLAELVPEAETRGVELWIEGNDLPLLRRGRTVLIQFEGWPAIQVPGWPGLALGTFRGEVVIIDAAGALGPGRFRVLVAPLDTPAWPRADLLRQGVRAHGWVLLDRVPLGYELWRRFNAFPPRMPAEEAPPERPR